MSPHVGVLEILPSIVGVWSWDLQTDIVVTCARVSEYFNIPPETGLHGVAIGRILSAVDPRDLPGLQSKLDASVWTGSNFDAVYAIDSDLHGHRTVRATGQCFVGRSGMPAYVSGILVDHDDQALRRHESLLEAIDFLMRAREMADRADQSILVRLIDAVLLHAAQVLAHRESLDSR